VEVGALKPDEGIELIHCCVRPPTADAVTMLDETSAVRRLLNASNGHAFLLALAASTMLLPSDVGRMADMLEASQNNSVLSRVAEVLSVLLNPQLVDCMTDMVLFGADDVPRGVLLLLWRNRDPYPPLDLRESRRFLLLMLRCQLLTAGPDYGTFHCHSLLLDYAASCVDKSDLARRHRSLFQDYRLALRRPSWTIFLHQHHGRDSSHAYFRRVLGRHVIAGGDLASIEDSALRAEALKWAAHDGDSGTVSKLLKHMVSDGTGEGATAMVLHKALCEAAAEGHETSVQSLLVAKASPHLDATDVRHSAPSLLSCFSQIPRLLPTLRPSPLSRAPCHIKSSHTRRSLRTAGIPCGVLPR
jgi:hypothetical protein